MTLTPLVSIVTPTLQRADLLERTLRSVRGQTYPNVEHIVVDGGSTDGTVELLERYAGTYDLRWISEPDRGMYDAVNKGLRMARGEVLAYLNSDDLYFPWTVEVVVEALAADPGANLVFGDFVEIDAAGAYHMRWQLPFDLDYVRRYGFVAQPTVFWRRRVFDQEGGFDDRLRYIADCEYWMRVGARHRFARVDEVFTIDSDHGDNLRHRHRAALEAELAEVRSRFVTLSGPAHRAAMIRHRLRHAFRRRVRWVAFLLEARRPSSRRRRWRRFLALSGLRVSAGRAILAQTPRIGWRVDAAVIDPGAQLHRIAEDS